MSWKTCISLFSERHSMAITTAVSTDECGDQLGPTVQPVIQPTPTADYEKLNPSTMDFDFDLESMLLSCYSLGILLYSRDNIFTNQKKSVMI